MENIKIYELKHVTMNASHSDIRQSYTQTERIQSFILMKPLLHVSQTAK